MLPDNVAQRYTCCTYKSSLYWFKEMCFGNSHRKFRLVEKNERIQWKWILIKIPFIWHIVSGLSRDNLLEDSAVYKTDLCFVWIEPGSKRGDKALESDAIDTGSVMGWGVRACVVFLVPWMQKRKDRQWCARQGLLRWGQSREGYWGKNCVPSYRGVSDMTAVDRFRQIRA